MKWLATFFFLTSHLLAYTIPLASLKGTINPGTRDYILHAIKLAEKSQSPFLIIELDTPGGLLSSTREIVQEMLRTPIPIVVFVGPAGAQAASAGAIIALASDLGAISPGSNIGAAHPVGAGGEKMDETSKQKSANDTAAFAESLARAKKRNPDWAVRAVKNSESIPADRAIDQNVLEIKASDLTELLYKLPGAKLKTPKGNVTELPHGKFTVEAIPMTVQQKIVSFFADPSLAYMILSLGGICIWIELSHPGLILPGVVGAICILVSLVSFQLLPISYGALFLLFLGMAMLIAEAFVPSFGVLGIGGVIAFILGSLYIMDTPTPELQLSLALILPVVIVLLTSSILLGVLVMKSRRKKVKSGMGLLVDAYGEVREPISRTKGRVFVEGELWNAVTEQKNEIPEGLIVRVKGNRNMVLIVEPMES